MQSTTPNQNFKTCINPAWQQKTMKKYKIYTKSCTLLL